MNKNKNIKTTIKEKTNYLIWGVVAIILYIGGFIFYDSGVIENYWLRTAIFIIIGIVVWKIITKIEKI